MLSNGSTPENDYKNVTYFDNDFRHVDDEKVTLLYSLYTNTYYEDANNNLFNNKMEKFLKILDKIRNSNKKETHNENNNENNINNNINNENNNVNNENNKLLFVKLIDGINYNSIYNFIDEIVALFEDDINK